ncbi:MAG: translation initiation factor IF-2 N-terminal domain-containing protein [Nostoc sp. NMS7]|nr:translation initiation factor IF-2 N-terminal domain-containing protein [Nostoc sp. NMS7]
MNNAQLRIYELSKEFNLENKELLAICDQLNIVVRSHSSRISESEAEQIRLAAEKLASKKGTPKNELGITSHQPKSPEIISQNRLAPLLRQQILEIPKPIIFRNRLSNIRIWEVFLQIEEKIAKARQFCVPFFTHNGFGRRITFEIDVTSATLEGSDENSLTVENFWERVKLAKSEEIKLSETTRTRENWHSSRNKLGTIEKVVPNSCTIRVTLKDDLADDMAAGRYQLPATGFLFFEAVGDIQQIKRKKEALAQLKQGRTQNPYLGNFLFDASQARPIQKTVELRPEDLLLSSANPSQKAAVEMVLAAEDLVLI